jgi:hypothetical protein
VRILFDQGTPAPLRHALTGHTVETAFEVFITTDKNLKYQQNLAARSMSIVVLSTTSWPRIQLALPDVLAAVESALPAGYTEVVVK